MKKYVNNFNSFVNESKNVTENSDYEMAMSELNEIAKFSQMIMGKIQAGEDLPAWVQSKISVAAHGMNSIYQSSGRWPCARH